MPIYEYRCTNGHTFDVMQRFSDDPISVCQVCEAPAKKLLRAPAIHFKGSGFHNTDYGRAKRVGGSGGEGDSGGGSDSKGSDSGSGEKRDTAGASKSDGGSSSSSADS